MNEFQKDLLKLRKDIMDNIRAQLMGHGSEVSYPDAEHELISEPPAKRYSVGVLYPQNQKFGDNDAEDLQGNETEDYEDVPEEELEENKEKSFSKFKDDSLDEETNLAQQNKPSSFGFTFFVSGDIKTLTLNVSYAKYVSAKDEPIIVPYDREELYIPDFLSAYISFDKQTKTIKRLERISWNDLNELFERNAIENPELLNIIANINKVFGRTNVYRRCPYEEELALMFESNSVKIDLSNVKGYVTVVKHRVTDDIYSVTVMMVNDEKIGNGHIFQPKIIVDSKNLGGLHFVPYNNIADPSAFSDEEQSLDLLYRNKSVYGTGHGVALDWDINDGIGQIATDFMPYYEVPKINLDLRRETDAEKRVDERSLSMKYLSDLSDCARDEKIAAMTGFIDCYGEWIDSLDREKDDPEFSERYKKAAERHIALCRESYLRMKYGLELLHKNDVAWKAFLLANKAMFMQRIHGGFQKEEHYPDDEAWQDKMAELDYSTIDENSCRWRPFQLAFLLMSLRSIVEPGCKERDLVDLIWFPTGGGKTEAYLGLTAFTIFFRRLTNPSNGGTTVMMRYTLRLLTSQQFTRAATLICACEKIRKDEERVKFKHYNLGTEEITIGLWIGGDHVPNTNAKAKEVFNSLSTGGSNLKYRKDRYNKFQVLKCPWCGTKLVKEEKGGKEIGAWGYKFRNNKSFYLSCTQEGCEFESRLPIQIIDEELYKKPPTLLFGTVDKFAMMAWKGDVASFFGKGDCDAPDLIIQDELHLIAGPLGTMVGIYESAIDYLCSQNGKKPKIIASTATIRQAAQQCRALYNREVRQFPAQGLDAADSFFAKEIPTEKDFGRMYLGIMPSGTSKVMFQARASAAALQFVHELQCPDREKDQFYTLAIYFNSLRELGKASSVMSDDTKDFIKRLTYRQIAKRYSSRNIGTAYELTSRVNTSELNDTLDRLENMTYSQENIEKKQYPINVLLASNMISVGVDVSRLNLMFLQGQPKAVSEYIQASSRIGRSNPGLAVTLYDASKSRDRSYYEQFKSFHSAFYKYVEPTGITPFSAPARDRALHAVLISGARQSDVNLNADDSAPNILLSPDDRHVEKFAEFLYERVKEINSYNPAGMQDDSDKVRDELDMFIEEWKEKARLYDKLVYGDKYIATDAPSGTARLIKRFEDKNKDDAQRTLTSLRNVDKTVPISVLVWEGEYD